MLKIKSKISMRDIACLFFGITFILIVTTTFSSAQEAGEVLAVKKDVYVTGETGQDRAEPQMPLMMKDTVETGEESRTKLYFSDDSILNLGELSKVEIEEYMYSPEKKRSKSIYRLVDGSMRVVVGNSDLEVHTDTAVAAARGTKFIIWTETISGPEVKMISENSGVIIPHR